MFRAPRFALAVLLVSLAPALHAQDWSLTDLMKRMAEIPSSEARFTETRHVAILTAPLEVKGRLSYTRPDRVVKHVLTPFDERISVQGNTLTIENKARGETRTLKVQSNPVVWGLVEGMRATLAGDLTALNRFYRTTLTGTRAAWTLALEPLDAQVAKQLQSIRIAGADTRIDSIEIREANGDRAVMAIQPEGN